VSAAASPGDAAADPLPEESTWRRKKAVALVGLQVLRTITAAWLAICVVGTLLYLHPGYAHEEGIVPGMCLLSRATFAAGLIPVLAVVNVLVSATQRDRLDGGTFRALNAGLAVLSAGFLVGEAISPAPLMPPNLRVVFAVVAAVVSLLVGREHGFPTWKFAVSRRAPVSLAYAALSGVMALVGLGLFVEATVWQSSFFIYNYLVGSSTIVTSGSFCLMLAIVANVLQAAAVAGPKRLASDTYKQLNVGCIASGFWMLGSIVGTLAFGYAGPFTVAVWTLLGAGLVATGWVGHHIGATYQP
jgi:hypothetical protein